MKKTIAIILLLLVTTVLKAQDTSTLTYTKVYNDLKSLTAHSTSRVDSVLTDATRIVKSGAESTWTILVNQQRVIGYTYGILLILSLFTIYLLLRYLKTFVSIYKLNDIENINKSLGLCILSMLLIIVLVLFNASHVMTITTGIFNPEYGALQQLYSIAVK